MYTCCFGSRKFNHRAKSISISVFTRQEVEQLRESGGNAASNAIYMAEYDKETDKFSLPQENETDKIECFIKYKYIEKKWYNENPKTIHEKKKKRRKKHVCII